MRGPVFDAGPELPAFQSEADTLTFHETRSRSELVVALISGWIIEIRSTYPEDEPATQARADNANTRAALAQAAKTVGRDI